MLNKTREASSRSRTSSVVSTTSAHDKIRRGSFVSTDVSIASTTLQTPSHDQIRSSSPGVPAGKKGTKTSLELRMEEMKRSLASKKSELSMTTGRVQTMKEANTKRGTELENRLMGISEESVRQVIGMLDKFKGSSDHHEQIVFTGTIQRLFDEYPSYHTYPEKQLRITGMLFGRLIDHELVDLAHLGTALSLILDALRHPASSNASNNNTTNSEEDEDSLKKNSKMHRFGTSNFSAHTHASARTHIEPHKYKHTHVNAPARRTFCA